MIINETYHRHVKVSISLDTDPNDGMSSELYVAIEQTLREEDDLFTFVDKTAELCCARVARVWISDISTSVNAEMQVEWTAVFGSEGEFDPSRTVSTSVFGELKVDEAVNQKTHNQAKFTELSKLHKAAMENFKLLHKGKA